MKLYFSITVILGTMILFLSLEIDPLIQFLFAFLCSLVYILIVYSEEIINYLTENDEE